MMCCPHKVHQEDWILPCRFVIFTLILLCQLCLFTITCSSHCWFYSFSDGRRFSIVVAAFLIPYMAIRLNEAEEEYTSRKTSQLGSLMINRASIVGLTGGLVCLLSILWALYGRGDGNFGDLRERWEFLLSYLGSERLAYAFIWDICLYIVFQPWLIGDNLGNIQEDKTALVNFLRFIPVIGLVAYCLCLDTGKET